MKVILLIIIILIYIKQQAVIIGKNDICQMQFSVEDYFKNLDPVTNSNWLPKYVQNRTTGPKQKIPYFIFQTHQKDIIPYQMHYPISSLIQKNPEFSYRYFNSSERKAFLQKHMSKEVVNAYNKLVPNAFKADIWRYSVLYIYGGCYIDIAIVAVGSLMTVLNSQVQFVSTPDGSKTNGYTGVNSAFICAIPGNKILQNTINSIVNLVYNQDYGIDPLDISGPRRFEKGFRQFMNLSNDQTIIDKQYQKNVTLIIRDRELQSCIQTKILNLDNKIMFYNKYPNYPEDSKSMATIKLDYAGLYWDRKIYDQQTILEPLSKNYSISASKLIDPFQQDYRIPFQYQIKQNKKQ